MKPQRPLFWHQGLFLQPQHFQLSDLYAQSLLSPVLTYHLPYFWGVSRVHMDEEALKKQTIEITSGEFIFQDGTWIEAPGNAVIAPRYMESGDLTAGSSFKIYLGLHKWQQANENVSVIKATDGMDSVRSRFISRGEPEEIKDMHHGGPASPISFIDYFVKIFRDNEIAGVTDYFLLPIAELEFDGKELSAHADFAPPVVSIRNSDCLQKIVHNIREQVMSRVRKLEEYKSPKGIQSSDIETSYVLFLQALHSLTRYTPLLHHFTEIPDVHPWTIYGLLRQIVGELSAFTDRIDSLGCLKSGGSLLSAYDHENPKKCFEEASTLIGELLSSLTIGPESIIRLERVDGFFKSQIPTETFNPRYAFYLMLRTAENREKVLEVIHNIAKVSSVENMPTLIGRALPGIALEYKSVPPPGLPSQANALYFELDQNHHQWIEIQKSQSICLFWDQAPKDTTAQIIVLRK